MTIINMNLTPYMGPTPGHGEIRAYALAVDAALAAGKLTGPLHPRCPECGSDFSDLDEAHEDTEHIIVATTADTTAVIVGCEGYWVINPNLVGFDSPMWMAPDVQATIITPDGAYPGTPGAPTIVISRAEVEDRMRGETP